MLLTFSTNPFFSVVYVEVGCICPPVNPVPGPVIPWLSPVASYAVYSVAVNPVTPTGCPVVPTGCTVVPTGYPVVPRFVLFYLSF